jgi:glycosyltransferase 2 family protein
VCFVLVRSLGISLSPPETLMLLDLATLSTLVPTTPGYLGTYQLVFGHAFQLFGYSQTTGIIAATAVQVFCFGSVTILGGLVLLSRSG